MNIKQALVVGIPSGIILWVILTTLLNAGLIEEEYSVYVNAAVLIVAFGPMMAIQIKQYLEVKNQEAMFPIFLLALVEQERSGQSLPKAIDNLKNHDYGALTKHIRKMATQLQWNVPLRTAFILFANSTDSKLIRRSIATILEADKSGGDMVKTIESVANSVIRIRKITTERAASVYGQIVEGYVMYALFCGVMLAVSSFIIPMLSQSDDATATASEVNYACLFWQLLFIQSAFGGLAIGKLSEGKLMGGIKHSALMLAIGIVIFSLGGLKYQC